MSGCQTSVSVSVSVSGSGSVSLSSPEPVRFHLFDVRPEVKSCRKNNPRHACLYVMCVFVFVRVCDCVRYATPMKGVFEYHSGQRYVAYSPNLSVWVCLCLFLICVCVCLLCLCVFVEVHLFVCLC